MSRRKKVNYAEDSDSNEFEDFSASEDEWEPQQNESTEAESDRSDADFDAETTAKFGRRSSLANKSRPSSSASAGKSSGKQKRQISSLRSRMIKKYKPTPRLTNTPAKPVSKDITRILEQSQYQRRKSIASSHDSDSSGDDYLVKRNELDLKSSFFDITACTKPSEPINKVPEFDCNAGVKLSDSEDEEAEMEEVKPNKLLIEEQEESTEDQDEKKKSSRLIAGINKNSVGQIDFHQLVKYNKDAQEAEEKLKSIKGSTFKTDESLNVSKLLALGEGVSSSTFDSHHCQNTQESKGKGTKKRKKAARDGASDSDTDWEQVQDQSNLDVKDELQINIPLATKSTEEKKKSAQDVEMMIKRKLNRDMKEYQFYLHKVSLICHIAHGLYCNRILNSPILMAAALKLLPNKTCYPDGITCIKYFESIAKWYKQTIPIRKNQMYLGTRKRPKLGVSLALQIKYKEALCKKDFVLIFIILLRAMGFACRLVINLTPISIRPPQDKLHSLSTKLKNEKQSEGKEKGKKVEIKEIKKVKLQPAEKQVQKTDRDHDYCTSLKSKDKSKQMENQSKKKNESKKEERKSFADEDKKNAPVGFVSPKTLVENNKEVRHKGSSKTVKKATSEAKAAASSKVIKGTSPARETVHKEVKDTASDTVKDAKTIDEADEGPSFRKRAKKQSDNTRTANTSGGHTSIQKLTNERKILSLSEKLKKRSDQGDKTEPQRNAADQRNSPPVLEKINLKTVNTDYSDAPLLSPKVKSEKNTDTRGYEEGFNSPKHKKQLVENNTKLAVKVLVESPSEEVSGKGPPTPNLSKKLNKRGRKTKISVTNEKGEPELVQDKAEQEREEASLMKATLRKPKDVETMKMEDVTRSSVTQQPSLKPTTRSKKLSEPEISKPIENVHEAVSPEPFKEIKKNVGRKRLRASPNPKIVVNNASEAKVESLHFRMPTGRTTRSQSKQKQSTDNQNIPQLDGADDGRNASKKTKSKSQKPQYSDDDDFVPAPSKKPRPSTSGASKQKINRDRKVLSSSSEEENNLNKKKMDVWVEVYSEKEAKWVTINLFKSQVNNPEELRKSATTPVAYVFAWNNDNTMKDVSPRYCPQWNTATRKQRVEKEWLEDAICDYLERKTTRSKAEDVEFHQMHIEKPLPTSISEYKNHPLYALQRHLLKFEAIYPPDALTLGFVRGEPVYSRDCVHTLHSRETWLKSARVVKPGQKPYKIVKARPRWDRVTQSVITDIPLEIFGKWQTMDYDPPTAENGRVPRNAYGNVDLFKPTMLPKKTVHLDLPGLQKVCKKLKIDCAQAVVGFDFHQGACHPIVQGYVVCEEFRDTVIDAWNRLQEEAERKEDEKYYARVYGNWKKLYRGLLIRERLKKKYNFKTLKIDDGKPPKKKKS